MPLGVLNDLPEVGYVVFDKGNPVSAAFLRQVEGGFGLVDSALSNPLAPALDRRIAMDLVSEAIVTYAKKIGITQLTVLTVDPNTAQRAKDFGFIEQKDIVLHKALT